VQTTDLCDVLCMGGVLLLLLLLQASQSIHSNVLKSCAHN
jgi:hypothetical protein